MKKKIAMILGSQSAACCICGSSATKLTLSIDGEEDKDFCESCVFRRLLWEPAQKEERKDFSDYGEFAEYCNQSFYACDQLQGEWYYADALALRIYTGTFGNDNAPGARDYTYCEDYETEAEFDAREAELASLPEFIEEEEES